MRETGQGYHSPLFTVCGKAARQPLQAGRKDAGRRGRATTLLSLRCVARQLYSHYKQAARMRETGRGYHSPLFTVCGKAARQPLQAGRKDAGRRGRATTLLSLRCVARQLDSHYKQAARMRGDGAGLPLSSLYGVWQGS